MGRKISMQHRMALRTHALRRWEDPAFRERMSESMSEGAKKRWSDPEKRAALLAAHSTPESKKRTADGARRGNLKLSAEAYGLTTAEWAAMSHAQRARYQATHRMVKVTRRNANTEMWAKRLKMPVEKFALLSGIEKLTLKNKWNKNNKNNKGK